ncbi:MAG: DUF5671 domain-containing protein [Patescibacteria group bacterium]
MEPTIDRPKMSPKDFFVYVGIALSLYTSAGSLLAMLFAIINSKFPDALSNYYFSYSSTASTLQFTISTLLVVFPLFLVLSWWVRKDIAANSAKATLSIRKWFVWFTLFAAGAVVVGDVIALLNTYLGSEVTIRFVMKMLAVFAVAGSVFGYYFYDLRRSMRGDTSVNKPLIVIAALLVLGAIVCGFLTIGSPSERRALKFDEQRVSDLSGIQWEVLNYWQTRQKLPVALSDLSDEFSGYVAPTDPETGETYEYAVTGQLSFDLCATFARESVMSEATVPARDPWGMEGIFEHGEGRTCFERTVDPQKYPAFPKY